MMKAALAVALVILAMLSSAALAQERKLEPADEAAKDASWVSFRNRLLAALEKRDRKFLLSVLDRNVRSRLEGPRGIAAFRKQWEVDAEESGLWRELSSALFLGAAYIKREKGQRELCAPYVLARWPEDMDPRSNGAIITREVLVKAEPSSGSQTLAMLSYHIVAVADWEVDDRDAATKQKWVKIKLQTAEGFVPEEQIRSAVEHAACFIKTESGWRMTALAPAGG